MNKKYEVKTLGEHLAEEMGNDIMNHEERLLVLSRIARCSTEKATDRLKAIEMLDRLENGAPSGCGLTIVDDIGE